MAVIDIEVRLVAESVSGSTDDVFGVGTDDVFGVGVDDVFGVGIEEDDVSDELEFEEDERAEEVFKEGVFWVVEIEGVGLEVNILEEGVGVGVGILGNAEVGVGVGFTLVGVGIPLDAAGIGI